MTAAVHLGQHESENLVMCRNTNFEQLKTLFDNRRKLILDQDFEILNVTMIERTFSPCMRSTLLHDKITMWAKAKVHVCSDSVLCLGKMHEHSEAHTKWRDQLQYSQQSKDTMRYPGSMENQQSVSGIFSQNLQHCRLSKRFKTNCKLVTRVQKTLKIELS